MGTRIALSESLKEDLLNPAVVPQSLHLKGTVYSIEKPVAAGHKGAVWKARDEFGRERALKLALYDDYADRSYLQELTRAARLEKFPELFAQIFDAALIEVDIRTEKAKFVCFVEQWVDGTTLQQFLQTKQAEVGVSFFCGYVHALSNALAALRSMELQHDDLHSGNVMIVPSAEEDRGTCKIRVIDTGSLKPFTGGSKKAKDDHRHFIDHL